MHGKVLVADHETVFAGQIAEAVRQLGTAVAVVRDGGEALALLQGGQVGAALLAMRLPGRSGLEVARAATQAGVRTPMILMCGGGTDELPLEPAWRAAGAIDLLRKPFSLVSVARRLHDMVRPRSAPVADDDAIAPPAAPREAPMTLPRSGTLDAGRWVQFVTTAWSNQASGVLRTRGAAGATDLFFLGGLPVWCERPAPTDLLGWLAQRSPGGIDLAAARQTLGAAGGAAAALRAAGLSGAEVAHLLAEWVREGVACGFEPDVPFEFDPGADAVALRGAYEVNPIFALWLHAQVLPVELFQADLDAVGERALERTAEFGLLTGHLLTDSRLRTLRRALDRPMRRVELRRRFADDWTLVRRALWLLLRAGGLAITDRADREPDREGRRASRLAQQLQRVGVTASEVAPVAAPDLPADRELHDAIAQVRRDSNSRIHLDHYGFLGLTPDATAGDIRDALRMLRARYERVAQGDQPDLAKRAGALLARLHAADRAIGDVERRRRYDDSLARQEEPSFPVSVSAERPTWLPESVDGTSASRARRLGDDGAGWLRARRAMASAQWDEAIRGLQDLRARHPSDAGILTDLGWSVLMRGGQSDDAIDKAAEWIELALAFEPGHKPAQEARRRLGDDLA